MTYPTPDRTHTHKRGASFDLLLQMPARFADGYFLGYALASQIRRVNGTLIADIDVSWTDAASQPDATRVLRLGCLDTRNWPVGVGEIDVRLTAPTGHVLYTKTVTVYIIKSATND